MISGARTLMSIMMLEYFPPSRGVTCESNRSWDTHHISTSEVNYPATHGRGSVAPDLGGSVRQAGASDSK